MKYQSWIKKSLCAAGAGFIFSAGLLFASSKDVITIERFISPEVCGGCHSEIFDQWKNSMHHLSHKDPVYSRVAKFLTKGLTDAGEIKEAESCVKCHTPVGNLTGFPMKVSDDLSKTPEIATQGIQCDYCHSAESITRIHNNGLVLKPGHGEDDPGVKLGPFDDAAPDFHDARYSKLHTEAEICGTCHDVKHVVFGTDLETTYTEWKNSPYHSKDPAKNIPCQGCHMFQKPGIPATGSTPRPENPGSAADGSMERPHIFTHYFIGGNSGVPGMFDAKGKAEMAAERLQNAATLSLDASKMNEKKLFVTIANTGAGHSIPTGVADLRQVWLEITIKDKDNKPLFQTGALNDKQDLPENTVIFRTVFGDGKGNKVINIAKAKQILKDNRIKAKSSVTEVITLPFVPEKGSRIEVRLLYRSMPPELLRMIPEEPFEPLPVVEMAKVQTKT